MKFDKIIDDGRLWSVHYDAEEQNELELLFDQWNDPEWLFQFFSENFDDLAYFKVTNLDTAIYDTMEDSDRLECLILDISPDANLDELFLHLENNRTSEMMLGREKARIGYRPRHDSWLRIYAIKLNPGIYVITGGAIKLTFEMKDRKHTLEELQKLESVRDYLKSNGVIDDDSFNDLIKEG